MTVAEQIAAEHSLGTRLEQYAGEWVAIRDHEVIASATTLGELLEQVGEDTEVEILQVARNPHAACFF